MNYKAQLKGWCVDRVTEICKVNGMKPSLQEVMKMADELADYAYVPSKDMEDTASYLFDLVRNAPPGEAKVMALIGTLEHIQNDRYAQRIDIVPKSETETVQ